MGLQSLRAARLRALLQGREAWLKAVPQGFETDFKNLSEGVRA
jgi:hypothetical protein